MVDPVEDLGLEIGDDVRSIEDALRKHTKPEVGAVAACFVGVESLLNPPSNSFTEAHATALKL
jgi:hypothetical protein